MDFTALTQKWCNLDSDNRLVIVADSYTLQLADSIKSDILNEGR